MHMSSTSFQQTFPQEVVLNTGRTRFFSLLVAVFNKLLLSLKCPIRQHHPVLEPMLVLAFT
jgi:hypothetical protein